jgi:CHAD domain-containing protein
VKARAVKHLDPAGSLHDNAQRIIAVRAQEVLDLGADAQDPADAKALHDLRIAAKRLRYLLELTGPAEPVKPLKRLQDVLGEIHDCDVQLPAIRALARESPEREAAGLRTLAIHFATRRAELYERFHQGWPELERTFTPLSQTADGGPLEVGS